jgi:prolyl-tRNA synthetase
MKLSKFFLPIMRDAPKEAVVESHMLMLRAGLIQQTAAGIYSWLPLGYRVLRKIEQIVREEQERAGALEMLMPTIQSADLWRESGRYEAFGPEMLRFKDRQDRELLYGPTNEEMITTLVRDRVQSYKSLPLNMFHIQWKFRDEVRPRFGVMRGREFLMKDGYSFDVSEYGMKETYARMFAAYIGTFGRMGLKTVAVEADTGPIGGGLSHEFHVLADTGESDIYYDERILQIDVEQVWGRQHQAAHYMNTYYAREAGRHDPTQIPDGVELAVSKGIEVGHIFALGQKYSQAMNFEVQTPEGKVHPYMGCYGIGVSRLMAAIIEAHHDAQGIVWPVAVAPFTAVVICTDMNDPVSKATSMAVYADLLERGVDVAFDDRDMRAGQKFNEMDLLGIPRQVIVGPRGLENGQIEVKKRESGERFFMDAAKPLNLQFS